MSHCKNSGVSLALSDRIKFLSIFRFLEVSGIQFSHSVFYNVLASARVSYPFWECARLVVTPEYYTACKLRKDSNAVLVQRGRVGSRYCGYRLVFSFRVN